MARASRIPLNAVARACMREARAATAQAKATDERAAALHQVADERLKAARRTKERREVLEHEAGLSRREANLHERAAAAYRAEARRAEAQAGAEMAIDAKITATARARRAGAQ